MYQMSYDDVLDDDPRQDRHRERDAFTRVIALMEEAEAQGAQSRQGVDAMLYTRRLWMILMEDLSLPTNDLPPNVRADLISIGIWVLKELDALRLGRARSFAGIRDICVIIRDGLN